jgi:rhodanese-related sulfurtransferase
VTVSIASEVWLNSGLIQKVHTSGQFLMKKTFLFYCSSRWRIALTVATLQKLEIEKIAHLTGGFSSWIEDGGEIIQFEEKNRK